ncbi:ISAs1-like element ISPlu18 family transposase [Photorhabdus bodei]|uniref:ISAs1-like element ISPlu18 family transposase n=2 Tax=Photorhabdus TaxID=29487 RepID=A0AAW6BNV9_9GAMM|nr:ISAs1-like element ISPlu18 family transposase [Photorhabdus bodei]MDB6375133.1 ISAs1-like element ISPlu18 family transposase [Photorhabdus bodei]
MSIFNFISKIEDPRSDINKKHELMDVIFLAFSAVLCGASGWKSIQEFGELQSEWLKQYTHFTHGIPRRHCIANIIKMIEQDALVEAFYAWINQRRVRAGKSFIAIDGKTLRGTCKGTLFEALHVVSAYDVESGVALYHQAAESKGQEGPVARQLIELLALDGAIVTMDALHCQKETLALITQRGGDFIVGLKGNQKTLHEWVKSYFASHYESDELVEFTQKNSGHGRTEFRHVMQIRAVLPEVLRRQWPSIQSVIEVVSERSVKGQPPHRDSRWYVSSLPLEAEIVAKAIRRHWSVENELHWVLDVTFREDAISLKDPDGAAQMALFNRIALSVIKQNTSIKDSQAAKRRRAIWSGEFRSQLIFD